MVTKMSGRTPGSMERKFCVVIRFRSTSGFALKKLGRRWESQSAENAGEQQRVSTRLVVLWLRIRSAAWEMLTKDNCTASKKIDPAAVSSTARPTRLNSSAPR
ncbi:hypothetical protein D9M73_176120 [compost metagenome]